MRTVSLTYNEKNPIAQKTMEYVLSLGLFKMSDNTSAARKKTLQALKDARDNKDVTLCSSFEDYLKAVE